MKRGRGVKNTKNETYEKRVATEEEKEEEKQKNSLIHCFLSFQRFFPRPVRPTTLPLLLHIMCWSLPASATFGVVALATGVWRYRAGDHYGKTTFFLYFAAMEFLQCASYLVINDCASVANQVMTALAW